MNLKSHRGARPVSVTVQAMDADAQRVIDRLSIVLRFAPDIHSSDSVWRNHSCAQAECEPPNCHIGR